MTLEAAMEALEAAWRRARDATQALRLTVCEDAPTRDRTLVVEETGELATDLAALVETGRAAVADLLEEDEPPARDTIRHVVSFGHDRRLEADEVLARLTEPRRLFELADVTRRRGGNWPGWLASVLAGLEDCRPALRGVDQAQADSWRGLAEMQHVRFDAAEVGRLRVSHANGRDRHPGEPILSEREPGGSA
jgi:hypothetical protein